MKPMHERTFLAKRNFYRKFGAEPTKLYVGTMELFLIGKEVEDMMVHERLPLGCPQKFYGLHIIHVARESHFNVTL